MNKKLTEPAVRSLKAWLTKAKVTLIAKCKEDRVAILVVFTIFTALTLFMSSMDTRENRLPLAISLLCLDYLMLVILIIAHSSWLKSLLGLTTKAKDSKAKSLMVTLLAWFEQHNLAVSFLLAFTTLLIFEEVHRINLVYNLTIAFCYTLILYRVVRYIEEKSQDQPQSLDLKNQKIYIIYASFIALSFFFSTTVDESDYGTGFQLTILSWLMLIHLLSHWFMAQWKLVQQLKNERSDAELMHLKSQVNPHFLFNTLNNLYGLALEKSDQTPGLILKLSDMLRYTIYQGKKDQVLLSEEINYLNDFIQLQQIRYHKPVNISFDCAIDDPELVISPLLLLILVENAYKHGVEKLTEEAFVVIKLEVKERKLIFTINNNFDESEQTTEPGIGLQNLTKRLQLIYPDAHQLDMTAEHGLYSVQLTMKLKSEHK